MPALAARSVVSRSTNVLSSLRDLRDCLANGGDSHSALIVNDAVVWIKDTAETISASDQAMRLADDLDETRQYLIDAVRVQFPAFEPPRLLTPTVTIHCGDSMPLLPQFDLEIANESHLGEVRGSALVRLELQAVSVPNGEATYSANILEPDDLPPRTLREAGLTSR